MRFVKRALAWGALTAYCAFVFVASAMSEPPGAAVAARTSDKVVHAGVFFVMAALAATAARVTFRRWRDAACAWFGGVFAVAYGVSDELHQRMTPGRTSDVRDVIADAVGAAVAAIAFHQLMTGRAAAAARRTTA